MECYKTVLDIGSCAHFRGAAQQYPDLTASHLCKQLFFPHLRVGVMNEGNLGSRHPTVNQLLTDVLINGEVVAFSRILLGRGDVTENQLG